MKLGKKIYQLRKLSGMTQEQLADKLNVTRQTLSKWENEASLPDVESVVRLSTLFHTSLEELLSEEETQTEKKEGQITLEDLMRINAHNRKMNMLLCCGLVFLAIGIMTAAFEWILENTIASLEYILYRYMVTGQYQAFPADYSKLIIPAALTGGMGFVLCLCYFVKNRKEKTGKAKQSSKKEKAGKTEQKNRKKYARIGAGVLASAAVITAAAFLSGRGKKADDSEKVLYEGIIEGLGDEEQFSLRDIGEENRVLFTTDMTYDDGNGNNAAISCNVYYDDGETVYPLGEIASLGTAYPVSFGKKSIYTASQHSIEKYAFDKKMKGWTIKKYEEFFDADGNASYQYTENGETSGISEKEYQKIMEEYGESVVVNFGYGASDNPW